MFISIVSNRNRIQLFMYLFIFILDSYLKKRDMFKCPAIIKTNCKCDGYFEYNYDEQNLTMMFEHVQQYHQGIYGSMSKDMKQ